MKDSQQVWGLLDIVGQGLSKGGDMVSRVHRSIADESFNVLEKIPATAPTSKLVRAIHDQVWGVSYGSIKLAGEALSQAARSRFDAPEDDAGDEAPDGTASAPAGESQSA